MATFKELTQNDIKAQPSVLSQIIDVIQEDISGSNTRRKFPVFVTGGIGPGITSSQFQTVYDQDFSLQTSNPVFDITVGLFFSGSTVQDIKSGEDSSGKLLFPSTSVMMREKVDLYKQFAQTLLGDADGQFTSPVNSSTEADKIDEAMFICFKRLFHRDGIKRETFAIKFFESASHNTRGNQDTLKPNLNKTSESGSAIYTDVGSAVNKEILEGGSVSNIVDSSDTSRNVGLMFNDRGIAVFDLAKILSGSQHVSGTIDAMNENAPSGDASAGQMVIGDASSGNLNARFIPDLMTSASLDDIIDHLAGTRFSSGSQTAMTFQNQTKINSTLFFVNASADEFNYSSNPTYTDGNNRIVVIDEGEEDTQQSFTFISKVGLYDANNNLLAVASTSRPIEKSPERALLLRLRLDY